MYRHKNRQCCVQIERQTSFTHKDSIVRSQKADYVVYRQSRGQSYVQTERQTIYVLCRQADRQYCVQIDGHVQTTLYTDRETDTALHIDEMTDGGWVLYVCTNRKTDIINNVQAAEIYKTIRTNTECMTDNVQSLRKETQTS